MTVVVTFATDYATKSAALPFRGTSGHRCLDLLGTPACVGLAHVARWLDRGDEFESNVADTDNADNAASNVAEDVPAKKKTTKKDIDYDMELDLLQPQPCLVYVSTYKYLFQ